MNPFKFKLVQCYLLKVLEKFHKSNLSTFEHSTLFNFAILMINLVIADINWWYWVCGSQTLVTTHVWQKMTWASQEVSLNCQVSHILFQLCQTYQHYGEIWYFSHPLTYKQQQQYFIWAWQNWIIKAIKQ